ncbi:MAG: class I SAM-dependent methyltransferase [Flavobacteriales bacterium]|nr:class I SAM-dependent methyltransferase [Flavobacteriales bacterium]
MSLSEKNSYILGTDQDELHRLGVQHQVWSSEALRGWNAAGFKHGDVLLDLGCGPGYCSQELAYITGREGKVIGIDLSEGYIAHLNEVSRLHGLRIETICADFADMQLETESLDGMYCRWALAWVPDAEGILKKVHQALRPGGRMVIHEYYDWSTHQTTPEMPDLKKAIAAALQSFQDSEGEIDVGRYLPGILEGMDMDILSYRPMQKVVTPHEFEWQWPNSFYPNYFPRLVDMGYLTSEEAEQAMEDMKRLSETPGASLFCPAMVEIIAEKR